MPYKEKIRQTILEISSLKRTLAYSKIVFKNMGYKALLMDIKDLEDVLNEEREELWEKLTALSEERPMKYPTVEGPSMVEKANALFQQEFKDLLELKEWWKSQGGSIHSLAKFLKKVPNSIVGN